jgi:hypothetical protein
MKCTCRRLLLVLALLLGSSFFRLINSYAKQVDRFSKHHPKRSFANVGTDTDNWREFKTSAELNNATAAPFDESAFVWLKAGRVVGANFTFTSESGDWAHYVNYYFRENGGLAKVDARLNTFYGNLSVIREKYYDDKGKLLRASTRYLDLQSGKPKKSKDFIDEPIPIYLKAQDLPFYKIL